MSREALASRETENNARENTAQKKTIADSQHHTGDNDDDDTIHRRSAARDDDDDGVFLNVICWASDSLLNTLEILANKRGGGDNAAHARR